MKKTIIALTLAAASTVAFAQNTGFYVGGGVGVSDTKFNSSDFSVGVATIRESKDRTDTAWKLFGGYDFNKNLAIEAGYTDLGNPKYKYAGVGILAGLSAQATADQTAWFVAAKGTLPISQQFNLFGKLGVTSNHLKVSMSASLPGFSGSASKTHTDALIGVGAEYLVTKNVGIRAEYENYGRFGGDVQNSTGRTKADVWSISASFKF